MTDIEIKTSNVIAENITYYLNHYKMSRSELARRLKVSPQAVGYWCTGKKIPRMAQIDKMCEVFNVTRSKLVSKRVKISPAKFGDVVGIKSGGKVIAPKLSDFANNSNMKFSTLQPNNLVAAVLSKDELHIITLYRNGKYKEIAKLMLDKV